MAERKNCEYCGDYFIASRKNQRFCCKNCVNKNRYHSDIVAGRALVRARYNKSTDEQKLNKLRKQKKYNDFSEERKERKRESVKNYNNRNRDAVLERKRLYSKNNRDKINSYLRDKRTNNLEYRLRMLISRTTTRLLHTKNGISSIAMSIYSKKDYLDHLTFDPNFSKWVNNHHDYHLDHIIPISVYKISDINSKDFKKVCNPRNLRIIPAFENISKGGAFDMSLVKQYGIEDLLPEDKQIV